MENTVLKNFLVDSEKSGRHIVSSLRTGRKYYVEPIFKSSFPYWEYPLMMEERIGTGSVRERDSVITKEIGFDEVHLVDAGSPYEKINQLDLQYPDK